MDVKLSCYSIQYNKMNYHYLV